MTEQDKALIERLQNGDNSALTLLYDNYSNALYGVIIRICKDEHLAKNILQDTFVTIWKKIDTYDNQKGRFYTWAFQIARNKSLNAIRKSKKLIQTEDLSVYKDKSNNQSNLAEDLNLKGHINSLDAHHKQAIEYVYFNGLTHREAHEEMGVPLGTFKSYVRQALKQLRESYLKIASYVLVLMECLG
ncbi:MAG: RNA polymerase sigma factor [Bacteroidota bacterium]